MNIIGINSNYDACKNKIFSGGCALIRDGVIEIALAEERISRKKHDGGFINSYKFILNRYGLKPSDIDYFCISFYGNPLIPNEEIVKIHLKELGIENNPEKLIIMPSHHLSHVYAAYFLSPFDEAIIMVADNEGNLLFPKYKDGKELYNNYSERNSYYWAKKNNVVFIERDFEEPGSVGFGKAYNKFNRYLGLGNYLSVGKTMGLSSYGKPKEEFKNIDIWSIDKEGKLKSNMKDTNDAYKDVPSFFKKHNVVIPDDRNDDSKSIYNEQIAKDLAFYIQEQLNKWSLEKVKILKDKTGINNICISGGVALNGIMNKKIEDMGMKVFVPPYPSDPGQALGNAIYAYIEKNELNNNVLIDKKSFENFTYLGADYTDLEIENEVNNYRKKERIKVTTPENIYKFAAKKMSEGKILGWFQNRSEYGARALGNRSIIADPRTEKIRDRVNILKRRELFRPIAPSVLREEADKFFEFDEDSLLTKYMLEVNEVKLENVSKIKGVVHVDNTSRIQTVDKKDNEKYYKLISEFYNITGIPMIINTSFNAAGEPIVENATDAIDALINMKLDGLVCNNMYIELCED